MSEDQKNEEAQELETTFKIGGKEFGVKSPAGKKGRRATAYVLKRIRSVGDEEATAERFMDLLTEPEFEDHHLSAFIGVQDSFLETHGDLMEILNAVARTFAALMAGMESPEQEAAQKNLPSTQEAQEGE